MRVVIVSNLFPPDIGGPATYVPRIARELQARGHGVTVVGGAPPGHDARSDRGAFPFPVHRVSRGLSLPIRLVVAVLMMVRAAWRADCIYVQGLAGPERQAAGNAAVTTLPALNATGSLANDKALVVDGQTPVAPTSLKALRDTATNSQNSPSARSFRFDTTAERGATEVPPVSPIRTNGS